MNKLLKNSILEILQAGLGENNNNKSTKYKIQSKKKFPIKIFICHNYLH